MTCELQEGSTALSPVRVHVVEKGEEVMPDWRRCAINENLVLNISKMISYFSARWEPVLHDAFVVGAAVEFCDKVKKRPKQGWKRCFSLNIPVHDPDQWSQSSVADSLRDALEFVTGDRWDLKFRPYKVPVTQLYPDPLILNRDISTIIPFSNGLDSCVVAGLEAAKLGKRSVVRVRLGTTNFAPKGINALTEPFAAMPYKVQNGGKKFAESSVRSRGFRFALVSAIAAFLCGAKQVIVPESAQGALGPSLIPVGQIYPDYRSHPRFGKKMEKFLRALIGFEGHYDYPYIWNTKGEALARFIAETPSSIHAHWVDTRTCWKLNTQIGVNKTARQCGICAACILRRMSVHAAGQTEPISNYVWENLAVPVFESGVSSDFNKKKIFKSTKHDAVAGVLHMDHLARLSDFPEDVPRFNMESYWLSQSLGMCRNTVKQKLKRVLIQHRCEWENFMASLGSSSFIAGWVHKVRS